MNRQKFVTPMLEKHWPDVQRFEDVRTVTGCEWLGGHYLQPVDVIVGGFPCQDVSEAGAGRGIEGPQSGLWREMFRLVCELRPRYVVVENVSALLFRGIERVVGDLASIGYDAEWEPLSACGFGAPHSRDRVFIVAYPHESISGAPWPNEDQAWSAGLLKRGAREKARLSAWFAVEPALDRMVHGVPGIVDRIRPFGNAILPQESEWIARRIQEAEDAMRPDPSAPVSQRARSEEG